MNIAILAAGGQGNPMMTLLLIGAIFAGVYFFMLRPQSKKRKKEEEERKNLAKGDKVITLGGIHGKVTKVDEDSVVILSQDSKLRVSLNAVTLDPNQESKSGKENSETEEDFSKSGKEKAKSSEAVTS
jgi:preprotein translocase subunit YajC